LVNNPPVIGVADVSRIYSSGAEVVHAIRNVDLEIPSKTFVTIVGRSGSGKTTLLNLMAGLDKPTSGSVLFKGTDISTMKEKDLISLRRKDVGFVFQSFSLLPLLSAFENVELPLRISGIKNTERQQRTKLALEIVGLSKRLHHRPYELSGGEQQRVAIARAIVIRPDIIIADEPTGELDSSNAQEIFTLLKNMVREHGITVIATTHDPTLLDMADMVTELSDGSIVEYSRKSSRFR